MNHSDYPTIDISTFYQICLDEMTRRLNLLPEWILIETPAVIHSREWYQYTFEKEYPWVKDLSKEYQPFEFMKKLLSSATHQDAFFVQQVILGGRAQFYGQKTACFESGMTALNAPEHKIIQKWVDFFDDFHNLNVEATRCYGESESRIKQALDEELFLKEQRGLDKNLPQGKAKKIIPQRI